jgi:nitrate reductase alpha subunit
MTQDIYTLEQRKKLHDSGKKFLAQIETSGGELVHLIADDAHHAGILSKCWIEKFGANSAASYRILHNGTLNLIRFFDYRDVA